MSGFLGQILGSVLGGQQGGQPSAFAGVLQQVLVGGQGAQGGQGGAVGIASLLTRFQSAGLGTQAQSWVGTGTNQAVTPDQVSRVFTPTEIQNWAQQAGTTPEAMRNVLAQALPQAVDHATPGGQLPAQGTDVSALLARLLGGAAH